MIDLKRFDEGTLRLVRDIHRGGDEKPWRAYYDYDGGLTASGDTPDEAILGLIVNSVAVLKQTRDHYRHKAGEVEIQYELEAAKLRALGVVEP